MKANELDLFPVEPKNELLEYLSEALGKQNFRFRSESQPSRRYTCSFFLPATSSSDAFLPVFTTSSARVRPYIALDSFLMLRLDLDEETWKENNGALVGKTSS